ncbi:lipase 3-like [Aethina tumida]|uniref:lipase 3-like n=1 Tax=Aethina tumida TaxID=116153 RepID=UPI0021474D14|nr:lipase 3-like [Aethina tumida]
MSLQTILFFSSFIFYVSSYNIGQLFSNTEFNTANFVLSMGYPFESYEVETPDNYLITLHRIPYGRRRKSSIKRTPVLLMHVLLGTSENYMTTGEKSLAFMAADAGYDVWLPNARGSMHSRKHRHLDADRDKSFWDFTWHEIGVYDLPTSIDFVLNKTGYQKLHYLGHSQGATSFLVMASVKPEYKEKINVFVGLAPAVFFDHFRHPLLNSSLLSQNLIYELFKIINQYEMMIDNAGIRFMGTALATIAPKLFAFFLNMIVGDSDLMCMECLPILAATEPAGSSLGQIKHFSQAYQLKSFRQFDYGPNENMILYNSTLPPLYDLENMKVATYIFSSKTDLFASIDDVKKLVSILPNVVEFNIVPAEKFTHVDYIIANDLDILVFNKVLEIFKKYSS